MSFTKNGFHRTLIDRLDSKRERKSGLLSVMNGCFIINNFGQASCNMKFFKAQPNHAQKSHRAIELPPTNEVQRSTPFLEAGVCILAPAARSTLTGQDRLGSVPGKGRLCVS